MSNCIYDIPINGYTFKRFTESQLITFLQLNNIQSLSELKDFILHGKASVQEDVEEQIKALIDDSVELSYSSMLGDDYGYGGDTMTLTEYIDTVRIPAWKSQPAIRMNINKDEYIKQARKAYYATTLTSITEEELNRKIAQEFENWDTIKADSKEFHELFTEIYRNNLLFDDKYVHFVDYIKTHKKHLYEKLKQGDSLRQLFYTLINVNAKINTNLGGKKRKLFLGKHLKAKTVDGTKLGCHLDQLYVDEDGRIHIYNFKMTTSDSTGWSLNKEMKYAYEMALIKKMLDASNISYTGIELYNIPIVLGYNENASQILTIHPDSQDNGVHPFIVRSRYGTRPYLLDYEKQVEHVFEQKHLSNKYSRQLIVDTDLEDPKQLLTAVLPIYDGEAKGLQLVADSWISYAFKTGDIKRDPDHNDDYKIIFDDNHIVYVATKEEIRPAVQEHMHLLDKREPIIVDQLVEELLNNYRTHNKTFENRRGFNFSADYAQKTFSMYLEYDENGEHLWQFLENDTLQKCGILLFRNRLTKQIDVVVPSAFRVNEYIPLKYGEKNILGYYESHMNSPTRMEATYGNMEILRVLSILNQILPKITKDSKLGNISVITPFNRGQGLYRSFKEVVPEFAQIVNYLNKNVAGCKFTNNFKQTNLMDTSQVLYNLYESVNQSEVLTSKQKHGLITILQLDQLDSITSKEARMLKLQEIIQAIENKYGTDINTILSNLHSPNSQDKILAQIYVDCIEAVNQYNGMYSPEVRQISSVERYFLPQYVNPDTSVRYIANIYTKALDQIATLFGERYSPVKARVLDFYDKIGYSKLKSNILGSADKVYDKMYERNEDGTKTFQFVNPYSTASSYNLNDNERSFLKYALFQLAKTRSLCSIKSEHNFNYTSSEDPELIKRLKEDANFAREYFKVPLERASNASQNKDISAKYTHVKTELEKLKNQGIKTYALEKYKEKQGINYSDNTTYEDNLHDMEVSNSLYASYNDTVRRSILNLHEESYFETNIEYLLADSIEKQIAQQELTKVAFYGKCLLAQMHILGDKEGDKAKTILKRSMEEVEKYLKLNVFGKSIMEESSQVFMQVLDPAKRLMSHMLIAFNLRSAFRDTFEGLWQNISRSITHYDTNLTTTSIIQGYKKTVKDVFSSDRSINIMSELCLRYRLSNTDVAKIAERAKTGRGGIFNPDHWGYSTLRAPDFLNRMTMFAARCVQDGVWDAYGLDENQQLTYDCTKDKRFEAYFNNSSDKKAYEKAKGLYFTKVHEYNKEHPDRTITFNHKQTPLPEPYSHQEIENIKMVANKIYGAYDKSQKAMYENIALGKSLGMFTTWMNGGIASWFMRPGTYYEYFKTTDANGEPIIKKDKYSGNELWFDNNGNIIEKLEDGTYVDENNNPIVENIDKACPVLDRVPVEVQGIYYTLKDSLAIFLNGGGYSEFKKRVLSNKYNRDNLKKAAWDLAMWGLFALLFGILITPLFKEHQKECDNLVENMMCELLYNSSSNSYDGFQGIWAINKYILNDVEMSAPNNVIKLAKDGFKTIMGDKSFNALLYGNAPIFRTFKNSIKLAYPDSFKAPNTES